MKSQDLTKLLTDALAQEVPEHPVLYFLRKSVSDASAALLKVSRGTTKLSLNKESTNPRMFFLTLVLGYEDPIDHLVYWNKEVCLSKWTMHYEGRHTASVSAINTETPCMQAGDVPGYFSRLLGQPESDLVQLLREHFKQYGVGPK